MNRSAFLFYTLFPPLVDSLIYLWIFLKTANSVIICWPSTDLAIKSETSVVNAAPTHEECRGKLLILMQLLIQPFTSTGRTRVQWTTSQTQRENTKILSPSRALLLIYAGSKSGIILNVKSPIYLCSNTQLKCAGLVKGCAWQQQILFVQNPIMISREEFFLCVAFFALKNSLSWFSLLPEFSL